MNASNSLILKKICSSWGNEYSSSNKSFLKYFREMDWIPLYGTAEY
ncbi:MAG TPA: hypothetical protein VK175_03155 [Leadbetterella sp.]|nr:hypothetical protein [Leadbetterella sp.]